MNGAPFILGRQQAYLDATGRMQAEVHPSLQTLGPCDPAALKGNTDHRGAMSDGHPTSLPHASSLEPLRLPRGPQAAQAERLLPR